MGKRHLVLLVGLLGACGDDTSDANAPVTIKFLRHANNEYRQADEEYFASYMAAHPNVTIMGTTIDFASVLASLVGDLPNGRFPYDLVLIPPSLVCSFAPYLADVPTDVVTLGEAQNSFFAAPLAGSICGDRVLKGLPVEYNLEYGGVVVNLEKYQKKFPGKTPDWPDWSAFIAEASMLTEYDAMGVPRANGLDIDPQWSEPVRHILLSQILQRGGTYLSPSGEYDFSTPEARASFDAMVSWFTVSKVMFPSLVPPQNTFVTNRLARGATDYGWNDPAQPLSVMGYVGTFGLAGTLSQLPAGSTARFDYFILPPMVGKEHKFVQNSGWAYAVPRTSKNPKVAWDIAKQMALSPTAMRKWSAITKSLPALKENGTAEAAMGNPLLTKLQPLLGGGQWVGYIPAAAIEEVAGAMVKNFFDAVNGLKNTDQALGDMQRSINGAIARHR